MVVKAKNRLNGQMENGDGKSNEVKETRTTQEVRITPPDLQIACFRVIGNSPYVQHKFSEKAKQMMIDKQKLGSGATVKKVKRDPKDFQENYKQAQYIAKEGWNGIPVMQFKAAMVAACRLVDFKMTESKQVFWVLPDGYCKDEPIGLVRFTKGTPKYFEQAVRNETGVADIRARPMWEPGWECIVRIRYDAGVVQISEVTNLLMRAGLQVGIGEGRQASRKCVGCGWGDFEIEQSN